MEGSQLTDTETRQALLAPDLLLERRYDHLCHRCRHDQHWRAVLCHDVDPGR